MQQDTDGDLGDDRRRLRRPYPAWLLLVVPFALGLVTTSRIWEWSTEYADRLGSECGYVAQEAAAGRLAIEYTAGDGFGLGDGYFTYPARDTEPPLRRDERVRVWLDDDSEAIRVVRDDCTV